VRCGCRSIDVFMLFLDQQRKQESNITYVYPPECSAIPCPVPPRRSGPELETRIIIIIITAFTASLHYVCTCHVGPERAPLGDSLPSRRAPPCGLASQT
jgi:hypothetical protein